MGDRADAIRPDDGIDPPAAARHAVGPVRPGPYKREDLSAIARVDSLGRQELVGAFDDGRRGCTEPDRGEDGDERRGEGRREVECRCRKRGEMVEQGECQRCRRTLDERRSSRCQLSRSFHLSWAGQPQLDRTHDDNHALPAPLALPGVGRPAEPAPEPEDAGRGEQEAEREPRAKDFVGQVVGQKVDHGRRAESLSSSSSRVDWSPDTRGGWSMRLERSCQCDMAG